jgi:hypothetical protein
MGSDLRSSFSAQTKSEALTPIQPPVDLTSTKRPAFRTHPCVGTLGLANVRAHPRGPLPGDHPQGPAARHAAGYLRESESSYSASIIVRRPERGTPF